VYSDLLVVGSSGHPAATKFDSLVNVYLKQQEMARSLSKLY